jgi:hypothetical protein
MNLQRGINPNIHRFYYQFQYEKPVVHYPIKITPKNYIVFKDDKYQIFRRKLKFDRFNPFYKIRKEIPNYSEDFKFSKVNFNELQEHSKKINCDKCKNLTYCEKLHRTFNKKCNILDICKGTSNLKSPKDGYHTHFLCIKCRSYFTNSEIYKNTSLLKSRRSILINQK